MATKFFDAGSPVLFQVQTKKREPFVDPVLVDTTVYKISVRRVSDGVLVVDSQDMDNSSTGKYYYYWFTETTTEKGFYDVIVYLEDASSNADTTVHDKAVYLR